MVTVYASAHALTQALKNLTKRLTRVSFWLVFLSLHTFWVCFAFSPSPVPPRSVENESRSLQSNHENQYFHSMLPDKYDRQASDAVLRDTPVHRCPPITGIRYRGNTHATTALCLKWLESQDLSGKTVVDFGCGSGIWWLRHIPIAVQVVRVLIFLAKPGNR